MIHYIESTDSTNNLIKRMLSEGKEVDEGYCVYAGYQTAGRGQQGNGWESEAGKNLTFSVLLKPTHLKATEQFVLTEVITVALTKTLREIAGENTLTKEVRIKWPNDIYAGNRKLAGILVENEINSSGICSAVIGVGLNVNQEKFRSNAPNPVSLKQLTGNEHSVKHLLEQIISNLISIYQLTKIEEGRIRLHEEYMKHLYRYGEWHWYKQTEVGIAPINILRHAEGGFEAKITDVLSNGEIELQTKDNEKKTYHFKEIKYIIEP